MMKRAVMSLQFWKSELPMFSSIIYNALCTHHALSPRRTKSICADLSSKICVCFFGPLSFRPLLVWPPNQVRQLAATHWLCSTSRQLTPIWFPLLNLYGVLIMFIAFHLSLRLSRLGFVNLLARYPRLLMLLLLGLVAIKFWDRPGRMFLLFVTEQSLFWESYHWTIQCPRFLGLLPDALPHPYFHSSL